MGIVLLGAPGSGKGTQADLIEKQYNYCHISMGDLLRDQVKKETEIGKLAGKYLKAGNLVPDDIAAGIIKEKLIGSSCNNNFLFDGYPRTISQAYLMEQLLGELGLRLEKVIYIAVTLELIVKRLSGRRNCVSCGKIYHNEYMPSAKKGFCDDCGGQLFQRDDDKPDTIKERFGVYEENTFPLVSYYKEKGMLVEIDGSGNKNQIFESIVKLIKSVNDCN